MNERRFEQSLRTLTNATGRRDAVRALGASGFALLAALGLADASAKGAKKSAGSGAKARSGKRDRHRAEAAGQGGPVHTERLRRRAFKTRRVISEVSDPLPVVAGSFVLASADCGGRGKVVSCGFDILAGASQSVNVLVTNVGPNGERSSCGATLFRTTDVGSTAGAKIQAVAICRVVSG